MSLIFIGAVKFCCKHLWFGFESLYFIHSVILFLRIYQMVFLMICFFNYQMFQKVFYLFSQCKILMLFWSKLWLFLLQWSAKYVWTFIWVLFNHVLMALTCPIYPVSYYCTPFSWYIQNLVNVLIFGVLLPRRPPKLCLSTSTVFIQNLLSLFLTQILTLLI